MTNDQDSDAPLKWQEIRCSDTDLPIRVTNGLRNLGCETMGEAAAWLKSDGPRLRPMGNMGSKAFPPCAHGSQSENRNKEKKAMIP
jgi:hypothetical protein